MKNLLLRLLFLLPLALRGLTALACPACEKQQPKILRGITHGAGPESNWDYVIVWATVLIVVLTLWFSVKWLIRPGEKSGQHIKNWIIENE